MTTTLVKPTALAAGTYWTEKARYSRTGWTAAMLPAESGDSIGVNPSQLPLPEPGGWNLAGGSRSTESGGTWVQSAYVTRSISGLTVGVTYRIDVDVVVPVNRLLRVTVAGQSREYAGQETRTPRDMMTALLGDGGQTVEEQRRIAIEWEATATSTTLTLEIVRLPDVGAPIALAPAPTPYDVMTKAAIQFRDVVLSERHDATVPLSVTDARVTMDATWSPYVQAAVTCTTPDAAALQILDPLAETRILLTAADLEGGTDRTWDLSLRGMEEDASAGTILLTLESDEALLREYTPAAPDLSPLDRASDLRAVVEYVVGVVAPGSPITLPAAPISVQPRWDLTNLVKNPGFDTNVDGWAGDTGTVDRYEATAGGVLRHTQASAGTRAVVTYDHPVTPHRAYYARASVLRPGTQLIQVGLRFRDDAGVVIPRADGQVWHTGFAVASNGAWKVCEAIVIAPARAATADVGVVRNGVASGDVLYVDNVLLVESDIPVPFFYGGTPDDANYDYTWDGAANASTSRRTPINPRPVEALIWTPGTSAWAFLEQLLYASGYRLWCDESRVWHLTPDDAPGTTGAIAVTEATDARGTSSRDDDAYANTIIITYRWTDRHGYPWSETVVAGRGGPTKAYTFDDTPYPGGNPAERILAAAQVAGRTRTVTAPVDYTATPGMTLDLALPGKAPVTGTIRRVDFDLATGLMTIEAHKIQET